MLPLACGVTVDVDTTVSLDTVELDATDNDHLDVVDTIGIEPLMS